MRAILSLLLFGFVFSAKAQINTNVSSRFNVKVVLFEKINTSTTVLPGGFPAGREIKDIGTTPGYEYELRWKFLGQKGGKDIYYFNFTRMTKAGVLNKIMTSKEVAFDGKRMDVFVDLLHLVVLETPTEKDLE